MQDDGTHGRIGGGAFDGLQQRSTQRLTKGVDGGTRQADQGQAVVEAVVDQAAHWNVRGRWIGDCAS
ncbi:hypothetical protein D3C76_885550 [compost metagenome]